MNSCRWFWDWLILSTLFSSSRDSQKRRSLCWTKKTPPPPPPRKMSIMSQNFVNWSQGWNGGGAGWTSHRCYRENVHRRIWLVKKRKKKKRLAMLMTYQTWSGGMPPFPPCWMWKGFSIWPALLNWKIANGFYSVEHYVIHFCCKHFIVKMLHVSCFIVNKLNML